MRASTYSQLIADYAQMEISDEFQAQKNIVEDLVVKYEAAVKAVHETNDAAYTDFMARHLVEMAGDIVMSYLLMTDATRYNSESLTPNLRHNSHRGTAFGYAAVYRIMRVRRTLIQLVAPYTEAAGEVCGAYYEMTNGVRRTLIDDRMLICKWL